MATEAKELERVRGIHKMAQRYLENLGSCSTVDSFYLDNDVTWSREELLAWPERLEKMRSRALCERPQSVWDIVVWSVANDRFVASANPWLHRAEDQVARGLCLYREQLTDEQPTAVVEPEPAPKPVDPYEQHRRNETLYIARASASEIDRNEAARARNIAALRRELDRPVSLAEQPHPREWFSGRRSGRYR